MWNSAFVKPTKHNGRHSLVTIISLVDIDFFFFVAYFSPITFFLVRFLSELLFLYIQKISLQSSLKFPPY